MQQANIINMITTKYDPQQKHRLGTVSKKYWGQFIFTTECTDITEIPYDFVCARIAAAVDTIEDCILPRSEGKQGKCLLHFSRNYCIINHPKKNINRFVNRRKLSIIPRTLHTFTYSRRDKLIYFWS